MAKVHYQISMTGKAIASCTSRPMLAMTRSPTGVTCGQCKRTIPYQHAQASSQFIAGTS